MEKDYSYIYNAIKEIIDSADPINLLSIGAPDDEYDGEIQEIASGISKCNSKEEIKEVVYNVFKRNFGEEIAGNISLYSEIAELIFKKIVGLG